MKEQLRLLTRLGAPAELVAHFKEKWDINDRLPDDMRSSPQKLLEEACPEHEFHDILPAGWFFRPYSSKSKSKRADVAVTGAECEAPAIEQAYRRGYSQGFADYRQLRGGGANDKQLLAREKAIDAWRRRTVQRFRSYPGDKEQPPKKLFGGRAGISLRLRYEVFVRDHFRCKQCGRDAADGIKLEVDHVVPHSLGGDDSISNLQTLCADCNAGKSNRM